MLREFVFNILGSYVPATYFDGTNVVALDGIAGLDWTFIFTGVLFCIVVHAFFRIIGGIICKIF